MLLPVRTYPRKMHRTENLRLEGALVFSAKSPWPEVATSVTLPWEIGSVCSLPVFLRPHPSSLLRQVKGYAKLAAGKVTGNKDEVDLGKAKLDGKLE